MTNRNSTALSPVIASIILIAVTVAVAVVVASWMGGMTIGLMGNAEQTKIINVAFPNSPENSVNVTILNAGASSVTLQSATIDGKTANMTTTGPTYSLIINKGTYANVLIINPHSFAPNAKYTIKITTEKGNTLLFTAEATNISDGSQTPSTQWLSGWNFRKSLLIDGSVATAGTDYTIKFIVNYGVGDDEGENVYLENKAKTDFGDVRFAQSDKQTLISYWLESKIDSATATFWVKIPGNLTAQSQTIFMYYGNNEASSMSNGSATFIFYDDFSSDLSKWTKEVNGAHIYINSGHLVLDGGTTSSPYGHTVLGSSASYTDFHDGIIEADIFPSTSALPEIGFRGIYSNNVGYKARWDCRSGSESPWMKPAYNGWGGFGSSITRCGLPNQWQNVRIEVIGSIFKMYSNDVLKSTVSNNEYANNGEISLQNHYGASVFFDNIRVRKYVDNEPILSFWGLEENQS